MSSFLTKTMSQTHTSDFLVLIVVTQRQVRRVHGHVISITATGRSRQIQAGKEGGLPERFSEVRVHRISDGVGIWD